MRYKITCYRHGDRYASRSFEASDQFDATMTAIGKVLDLAYGDPEWANGRIELTNPNGQVIHEMAEKD